MIAAVGKLVADEADAIQISPHGEFFIFDLRLFRACAFLRQGLVVERKGENNVGAYFACVKFRIEAPKLDRVVAREKTMQVQKMVSA